MKELSQQLSESRLAGTILAHKRNHFARTDCHFHVTKNINLAAGITEMDILQHEFAKRSCRRRLRGLSRGRFQRQELAVIFNEECGRVEIADHSQESERAR